MRNNKGKKIIKPADSELMDYLNRGYAICNKCGAVMDRRRDPQGGCDIYTCPSCGWEIDEMDYEYEDGDEMELVLDERGDDRLIYRNDMPPAEGHTLTARHRARCSATKHYQRGGGVPSQGLFLFLFLEIDMRYHFEKPIIYLSMYGQRYLCDHPVYHSCTLFLIEEKGLAVIQQRYDPEAKATFWTEVDAWLTDALYLHPKFKEFFDNRARVCTGGLYPTVTIRQIMWALKMKPLPKQRWETVFDRRDI